MKVQCYILFAIACSDLSRRCITNFELVATINHNAYYQP